MRRLFISVASLAVALLSMPGIGHAAPSSCPIAGQTFDFCQYFPLECPVNLDMVCALTIPHGSECSIESDDCLGNDPRFCPCNPNDMECQNAGGGIHYTCTYTF